MTEDVKFKQQKIKTHLNSLLLDISCHNTFRLKKKWSKTITAIVLTTATATATTTTTNNVERPIIVTMPNQNKFYTHMFSFSLLLKNEEKKHLKNGERQRKVRTKKKKEFDETKTFTNCVRSDLSPKNKKMHWQCVAKAKHIETWKK